ncbi:MAG TPA: solute carrier family 23 protein, partial [Sphaerochaeta sp.]|nr:solute carrier family 23 protein [Sphaerochaeta sp.]
MKQAFSNWMNPPLREAPPLITGMVVFTIGLSLYPTATYSQNVGIVTTTKVINRYTPSLSAFILLIAGLVPKFFALLTTIPQSDQRVCLDCHDRDEAGSIGRDELSKYIHCRSLGRSLNLFRLVSDHNRTIAGSHRHHCGCRLAYHVSKEGLDGTNYLGCRYRIGRCSRLVSCCR